ncbi:adenylate cyclase [Paenibacillaceae bacterium]|nr:adenylate cyclase [Paenibacillaceae bacterium]
MNLPVLLKHYLLARHSARRRQTREELEARQHRKVTAFLTATLAKSPFFASYYKGLALEDWRNWPTTDKALMMANFDEWNTLGMSKAEAFETASRAEHDRDFVAPPGGITVGLSSGTSGNRGLFLVSPKERAAWAGAVLAKTLPGPLWQQQRIAFFLRADSSLYQTVRSRRIAFRYFDMSRPPGMHLAPLQQLAPTLLVAPPSMLRLLAEAQLEGRLAIAPRKIIAVAEVLEPIDRAYIEGAFQMELHQVYQCTEGFLGSTCAHGTLHLNEDILVVEREYLDDAKRMFSPIITDFSRTSQPIIRYRLNDVLTLSEQPCPCGSAHTALAAVSGRADDIFYGLTVHTEEQVPVFADFVRRSVMFAADQIEEYRIIQHSPTELEAALRIKGDEAVVRQALQEQICKLFDGLGCHVPRVRFVPYHFEPGLVKLRRLQRSYVLH